MEADENIEASPLIRLGGSLQWLSSKPLLPAIHLVPGMGTPISLCPDHLLANSPFMRQLLPAGNLEFGEEKKIHGNMSQVTSPRPTVFTYQT